MGPVVMLAPALIQSFEEVDGVGQPLACRKNQIRLPHSQRRSRDSIFTKMVTRLSPNCPIAIYPRIGYIKAQLGLNEVVMLKAPSVYTSGRGKPPLTRKCGMLARIEDEDAE